MEKIKIKTIIAACILSLLFVACSKDDNPNEPKGNQLEKNFPFLKVGNSWTMQDYVVNWDGIDTNTFTITLNQKVDTIINSTKYSLYYAADDEYAHPVFIVDDSTVGVDNMIPMFWKNYTVGQSWDIQSDDQYDINRREVVSVNETITVPAGTFNNVIKIIHFHYDSDNDNGYEDIWWIRNDVGIIKHISAGGGNWEYELKSKNF